MALEAALAVFAPREPIRTIDWAREHATDEHGHPYDDHSYPHLAAPGGPFDAHDCRQYLESWLQWGTRLGKTFVGEIGTLKTADRDPCPMLLVAAVKGLALEISGRTVRMIEHCDVLADQLPARRNKTVIELAYCRQFVGWPRSSATLADKEVGFGHGAEVDKWVHVKTDTEAEPLALFLERFKNKIFYKVLLEGSPGLKHVSRIERGRLAGTNAQLWVECQRCGRYQILRKEQLVFEQKPGRHDRELARATARYVCEHCQGENHDEDRGPMMRSGVWIPEGCGCKDEVARVAAKQAREPGRPLWRGFSKDADWITGEPLRDGRSYSSQLSSLYALSIPWGGIAEQMVKAEEHPEEKRNLINSWWAETYERGRRTQTWETLGERLMAPFDVGRGVLPPGYRLLTGGIDKQEDHYVVNVEAWAAGRTSHTADYLECDNEDELLDALDETYRTAEGKQIKIALSLLDSGFRPKDVYALVDRAKKRGILLIPCRGSTKSLGPGVMYSKKRLGKDTARPGAPYVLVDTGNTQDWIDRQLHDTTPGSLGGTSLFRADLAEHQDYLEQLLNEAAVNETWNKIDDNVPNDHRDAKRYAAVAMLLRTRGKEIKQQPEPTPAEVKARPKPKPRQPRTGPLRRPGGWLNMP